MTLPRDLERARYLLLTTFRTNGQPVATPVWFAARDGRLYAWTGANTGKVKRIRANPTVTVAPCTMRGRPRGAAVEARAEVVDAASRGPDIDRLLLRKYWIARRGLRLFNGLVRLFSRRAPVEQAYLEIRLA